MNVIHFVSSRAITGAAAAAVTDVRALTAAGHHAWIATRDGLAAAGVQTLGGFELRRGALGLLSVRADAQRLRTLIRELSIDVVHVHRSDEQLLAAIALGKRLTARLIRTWHRDPCRVAGPILKRLVRHSDGNVCVAREHATALNAINGAHAEFIAPGVETDIFRPQPISSPPFLIGQVGRWKEEKGADRGQRAALEVFAKLSRGLPWKGVLIGRGEMETALRAAAHEEFKLTNERVEFKSTQGMPQTDFSALLAGLSLGLVFRTGSDGTSRPAAEMLASGVPLVVADVPGLREFADDTASAQRQLANDPNGWAAAIEQLLRAPETLRAMSTAARSRAENFHSLNSRGVMLAEFYRNCV